MPLPGRRFLLLTLLATMSFTLLGIYRIQKVMNVSAPHIFHQKQQHDFLPPAPGDVRNRHIIAQQAKQRRQVLLAGGQTHEAQLQTATNSAGSSPTSIITQKATNKTSNNENNNPPLFSIKNPRIRSWGCERRTERPFIFVHCGKAGGGQVRARFAASAVQYNRSSHEWHKAEKDSSYYYPMLDNHGNLVKGAFVNSDFPNYRPSYNTTHPDVTSVVWDSFEGTLPCAAETPLGQALACPLLKRPSTARLACHQALCNVVYAGHNLLGNELHWLPNQFLANWWKNQTQWQQQQSATSNGKKRDVADAFLHRLQDWAPPQDKARCFMPPEFNRSLQISRHYRATYAKCVAPKEAKWDAVAHEIIGGENNNGVVTDWSPLYASLPVLRVTLLREPMKWLVSKFFWHSTNPGYLMGKSGTKYTFDTLKKCDNSDHSADADGGLDIVVDWVSQACLGYIQYLCGEDCVVRMHHGHMTLEQAEIQARHNLQRSFAVVGILEETQTFYDMVTARVQYMNTSLHPMVQGNAHGSAPGKDVDDSIERCKEVYKEHTTFAKAITARTPELATLRRLYRIGVQVYHAQKEELEACGSLETSNAVREEASVETQ